MIHDSGFRIQKSEIPLPLPPASGYNRRHPRQAARIRVGYEATQLNAHRMNSVKHSRSNQANMLRTSYGD